MTISVLVLEIQIIINFLTISSDQLDIHLKSHWRNLIIILYKITVQALWLKLEYRLALRAQIIHLKASNILEDKVASFLSKVKVEPGVSAI